MSIFKPKLLFLIDNNFHISKTKGCFADILPCHYASKKDTWLYKTDIRTVIEKISAKSSISLGLIS